MTAVLQRGECGAEEVREYPFGPLWAVGLTRASCFTDNLLVHSNIDVHLDAAAVGKSSLRLQIKAWGSSISRRKFYSPISCGQITNRNGCGSESELPSGQKGRRYLTNGSTAGVLDTLGGQDSAARDSQLHCASNVGQWSASCIASSNRCIPVGNRRFDPLFQLGR